jgi:hypothetical protein
LQTSGRYGCSQGQTTRLATADYSPLQNAARNPLACRCALAILWLCPWGVPSVKDEAGCQDLRVDAGIREQGNFRSVRCSIGARCPDSHSDDSARIPMKKGESACQTRRPNRFAHGSGTCCTRPQGGAMGWRRGLFASHLDVRRSIVPRIEVNSVRTWPLSLELCSKFLNESPPPVNIAYGSQIMSRVCDMLGLHGLFS